MANFNESLLYLRGNTLIDYEQLGLRFKLFSCEVLFNRGLCYIYDQQIELGMKDLEYAAKEKQVEDHGVIDDAIKERAEVSIFHHLPVSVQILITFLGIYRVFCGCWRPVPPERGQSQERQGKRLLGEGSIGRSLRCPECIYWVCWDRG